VDARIDVMAMDGFVAFRGHVDLDAVGVDALGRKSAVVFVDQPCDDGSSADGPQVGYVPAGLRFDVRGAQLSGLVRPVPVARSVTGAVAALLPLEDRTESATWPFPGSHNPYASARIMDSPVLDSPLLRFSIRVTVAATVRKMSGASGPGAVALSARASATTLSAAASGGLGD